MIAAQIVLDLISVKDMYRFLIKKKMCYSWKLKLFLWKVNTSQNNILIKIFASEVDKF